MFRSMLKRAVAGLCVCLLCTAFVAQAVRGNPHRDPKKAFAAAPTIADAHDAQAGEDRTQWAVMALLALGAVAILLRPKRRVSATSSDRREEL